MKGWGKACMLGLLGLDELYEIRPFLLVTGRTITGCGFGAYRPTEVINDFVLKYLRGEFKLDEYITHHFTLE